MAEGSRVRANSTEESSSAFANPITWMRPCTTKTLTAIQPTARSKRLRCVQPSPRAASGVPHGCGESGWHGRRVVAQSGRVRNELRRCIAAATERLSLNANLKYSGTFSDRFPTNDDIEAIDRHPIAGRSASA